MKKRMLASQLIIKDKIYDDKKQLFTGTVFWVESNGCVTAKNVIAGNIINDYLPICLPEGNAPTQIYLEEFLEIEGDIATLNNKRYTGVVISVEDDGFVSGETYYENLFEIAVISWSRNTSEISSYELEFKNYNLFLASYDSGEIHLIRLDGEANFYVGFTENKQITLCYFENNFAQYFKEIKNELKMPPFNHLEELFQREYAEEVTFIGNDIDNDYIKNLVTLGKFEGLKKIDFIQTNFNDYSLLLNLRNLEGLKVNDDKNFDALKSALLYHYKQRQLRGLKPIKITVNHTELTL